MGEQHGQHEWEVDFTGPENTLTRVVLSVAALSRMSWLSLIVLPPVIGGTLVASDIISGTAGQLAYPVFCLCVWLALATIGGSYRHVQYRVDESNAQIELVRDGFDSGFDSESSDENPRIPLGQIQSITVSLVRGHWIIRVDYGTINLSKPDTVIISEKDQDVWEALRQIEPDLPSLPTPAKVELQGYSRYAVTVIVLGVLPLAIIDQSLLAPVISVALFLVLAGLLRNLIVAIRRRIPSQEGRGPLQALLGSAKTLIATGVVLVVGYALNILF